MRHISSNQWLIISSFIIVAIIIMFALVYVFWNEYLIEATISGIILLFIIIFVVLKIE